MALVSESDPRSRFEPALSCRECGNSELFVEIMSHEFHLIDGKLNYLHLLDAVVDHYLCHLCGSKVEMA
jgi:hypothetical protein